jgi:glycosyltransferase involved in cell wall biosynthesis
MLSMSLGRPFVAPRTGSIPSVAPPGNVLYDDLAEGLRTVHARSTDELDATGERNRDVARSEYGWDDVASRTVALYGGDVVVPASTAGSTSPRGR